MGGGQTTSRVSLSVDFLPAGQEWPVMDAFLPSAVSVHGVFSGKQDTATFKLDVLVSTGIVHALVVKGVGCLSIAWDMSLEGESNFWELATIWSNLELWHEELVPGLGSLVGGLFSVLLGNIPCPIMETGDEMSPGVVVHGLLLISGDESTVIQLDSFAGPLLNVMCLWTNDRVSSSFCSTVNKFTWNLLFASAIIVGNKELSCSMSLGILPL